MAIKSILIETGNVFMVFGNDFSPIKATKPRRQKGKIVYCQNEVLLVGLSSNTSNMIKTVVTPHNNLLELSIPDQYIGKEIEVIMYSKDELIEAPKGDVSRFKGILTSEEAEKFDQHLKQSRGEWDRNI